MADTRILELVSVQSPFSYGEDQNTRALFSVNFLGWADNAAHIEEVVVELITDATLGTLGTDLFVGPQADIPTGSGPYISVISTAGLPPLETHNTNKYEAISFQIIVRALDYLAGRERINAIWGLLDGVREVTVTT